MKKPVFSRRALFGGALTAVLALLAALAFWRAAQTRLSSRQVFAMDTVMQLSAYGRAAPSALDACEDEIARLDALFSAQRPESDVARINAGAGEFVPVADETVEILRAAKDYAQKSRGALDVTVYPIVRAWGFISKDFRVLSEQDLVFLRPLVGSERIDVDDGRVRIGQGMQIDLGALAKGYTSQRLMAILSQHGVRSAMVTLGGNVQTLGTKPGGEKWRVAVQDPLKTDDWVGVLSVADAAVVTSGGYQRYFESGGVRYHHIIDPHTGYPADSGLISVTVVCPDGTQADALSTALFVLGTQGAVQYWKDFGGFEAVLVTDDKQVLVTPGLSDSFEFTGGERGYTQKNAA